MISINWICNKEPSNLWPDISSTGWSFSDNFSFLPATLSCILVNGGSPCTVCQSTHSGYYNAIFTLTKGAETITCNVADQSCK